MSHEICIPRLGWSMEEGTFLQWLKQPGDNVEVGDPLFELEAEKATQAIEAVDEGILYIPPDAPAPGTVLAVGTVLGYLLAPGEAPPTVRTKPAVTASSQASAQNSIAPTTPEPQEFPTVSPRAKRVARELGVDWTAVQGSGRDGRIREADIRAESDKHSTSPTGARRGTPAWSSRRRTIAERLRISQERTVPVTLNTTFDASNLVALREQFKATNAAIVPAYTDIVACVVARVLTGHPDIAARREDSQIPSAQRASDGFDIGIAVHTDAGLLTPILRSIGRTPLLEVAQQSKTLVEQARAGKLTADQMQGGVFTITSLGAYGVDAFTPIINYPQLAILGLGAIRRDVAVFPDGRIAPRESMTLSLTFDHAALDGAPAAAFLRDVAAALAAPAAALLTTP